MNAYIINIFERECSSLAETVHPAALNDLDLTGSALSWIANTCGAIGLQCSSLETEFVPSAKIMSKYLDPSLGALV